jgi:hypothetical protein
MRQDRRVYLFLLACASLRYVPEKKDQTRMASEFEWLSLEVMRLQMPAHAEVHLFGTNPNRAPRYSGDLVTKIEKLSTDIREKILVDLVTDFEPSDQGDNGLDLVAWIPNGDDAPGLLTVFGQCACTPAWVQKQHSSSKDAWEPIFRFTTSPVNYCFIPYDFRDLKGSWYQRRSIHNSVLMDRRRIMRSFGSPDINGNFETSISEALSDVPSIGPTSASGGTEVA